MASSIVVPGAAAVQLHGELAKQVIAIATQATTDINALQASGLPNPFVRAATTAALPACTYNSTAKTLTGNSNGALAAQDSVTMAANERILVKNQVTGSQNGIYVVTAVGDASNPFVLTRASDFSVSADAVSGRLVAVSEGTLNADTLFILTTNAPITLDTTALAFSKLATPRAITGGQVTVPFAAATAAVTEVAVWIPSFAGAITSIKYAPSAASTPASGSNSQTLAATIYDGAGGAGAAVAAAAIANATPAAAYVPIDLGTISNGTFAAGNVVSFKTTLAGTATMPAGSLVINYTRY